jgi:hypothetical protein
MVREPRTMASKLCLSGNTGIGKHNVLAKYGNLPTGFMHVYANVKHPIAKINNFHTFIFRCGMAGE